MHGSKHSLLSSPSKKNVTIDSAPVMAEAIALWEGINESDTLLDPRNVAAVEKMRERTRADESDTPKNEYKSSETKTPAAARISKNAEFSSVIGEVLGNTHKDLWLLSGIDVKSRIKQWTPLHCCVIGFAVLHATGHSKSQNLCAKRALGNVPSSTIVSMSKVVSAAERGETGNLVTQVSKSLEKGLKGMCHAKGVVRRLKPSSELGADGQHASRCLDILYRGKHQDVISILLQNGAYVDSIDYRGRTPLMLAASCNLVDILSILLDNGADISKTDFIDGNTALHYAYATGSMAAASLLEERGANDASTNGKGRTPMDVAGLISAIGNSILD